MQIPLFKGRQSFASGKLGLTLSITLERRRGAANSIRKLVLGTRTESFGPALDQTWGYYEVAR